MGLRLLPDDPKDKYPSWDLANLSIANTHPGLEKIFADSDWSMGRWADVLSDLEFTTDDGQRIPVTTLGPVRYGGPQCRGVLVPRSSCPQRRTSSHDVRPERSCVPLCTAAVPVAYRA